MSLPLFRFEVLVFAGAVLLSEAGSLWSWVGSGCVGEIRRIHGGVFVWNVPQPQ